MDIHKNARLTPHGRERLAKMILSGQTPKAASEAAGVCPRTGRKWRDRFEQEGLAGLQDRSSRPNRLRQPTPPEVIERIESLRRQRLPGKEIAATVGVSAGDGEPRAQAPGAEQAERPGTGRATPPIRARAARRDDPHRHQKARQVQSDRPPHHRRPHGPEQQPRRRLGVPPCLHRRRLARGLQQDHEDRTRALCRGLPQGRRRLLQKPRHHRPARHDRQRLMLQIPGLRQGLPAPQAQAHPNKTLYPAEPTARPSASSRHRYENGPMPAPISTPSSAPTSCPSSCTDTTGIDLMPVSDAKPPISKLGLTEEL